MTHFLLAVMALVASCCSALTPSTTPEEIIQSQLQALQRDDLAHVYSLASPHNKAQTGSMERFSQMVHRNPYRQLVGHIQASILLESTMVQSKQYLVRIVPRDNNNNGVTKDYWWSLSRCQEVGEYQGCYMVDAVLPDSV